MKKPIYWIIFAVAALGGLFAVFQRSAGSGEEIEYRYAPIAKGELLRSTSATGVIVAQTSIDVRSKAGGTIVQLNVDAGDFVKKGDVLAIIDPRDTRATFDQAAADVQSAQARIRQSQETYELQVRNAATAIREAEIALAQARTRRDRLAIEARRTPETTGAAIASAQAQVAAAQQDLERFDSVTRPQTVQDVEGTVSQTRAAMEAAEAELRRNQDLLERGYVAQSAVDRARSAHESARASYNTAVQRQRTLEHDLRAQRESLRLVLERAQANLRDARAQGSNVQTAQQNLREAEQAVAQAQVALQQARDAQRNIGIRRADVDTARASATRSRVALQNAQVQLEGTTVVAPRDGVVTLKYAEEGTVIPPGASQFSANANIVQLSDVTRLFVDCTVDEADIRSVQVGQKVRVVAEAYPGEKLNGIVRRVNPSATTANSITSITVRVEVFRNKDSKVNLIPGMNATCEFITLDKKDVLIAPSQAIKREDGATYVMVKPKEGAKPVRREVEIGEEGNDGVEIVSGLQEGEEVVIAEIDLAQLRETERRMMEAQQGGGLAGGGARPGGGNRQGGGARGGTAGGGARGGGGGGGR
jgi:HlyD family secretion protein